MQSIIYIIVGLFVLVSFFKPNFKGDSSDMDYYADELFDR